MTTEMDRLTKEKGALKQMALFQEIEKFEEIQCKHSKCGATDTEPNWVFTNLMRKLFKGRKLYVPKSADGWELFTVDKEDRRASNIVAKELAAQVEKIYKTPCTPDEFGRIAAWYGWNEDW